MVLEILCVEPINPQYSGVLETCVALRYCFFEVLGSESDNIYDITIDIQPTVQITKRQVHSKEFMNDQCIT